MHLRTLTPLILAFLAGFFLATTAAGPSVRHALDVLGNALSHL